MITFKLDPSREDAQQALVELTLQQDQVVKVRRTAWMVLTVCGLAAAGLLIWDLLKNWNVNIFNLILLMVVIALGAAVKPMMKKNVWRQIRSMNLQEITTYRVGPEGIHTESASRTMDFEWSALEKSGDLGSFFYLVTRDRRVILCDKDQVEPEELAQLRELAKQIRQ